MESQSCGIFSECSAPLCPLDTGLKHRIWYADEDVCRSRKNGQHRWIKKQRSIQKRQTKSWRNKPVTWKMLYDSSRPRLISPEERERLKERMKKLRAGLIKN
jgi:hypothetical protein